MLKKFLTGVFCVIAFLSAVGAEAVFNYPDAVGKTPGSNLRVVSYNILAGKWGEKYWPVKTRLPKIVGVIHKLQPDFAGLQEVDGIWYKMLADQIAPWKFAGNPYDKSMCAIIYDSRKYRRIDGGVYALDTRSNMYIRCLRWTLLENIQTGAKIIVTNTHWQLNVPKRLNNSALMAGFIKELETRFPGIPFFCTGDYNSQLKHKEFDNLLKATGFKDAVASATVTENREFGSVFRPSAKKLVPRRTHIDHIVVSSGVKVLSAKMVVGNSLFSASDHLPIMADFEI